MKNKITIALAALIFCALCTLSVEEIRPCDDKELTTKILINKSLAIPIYECYVDNGRFPTDYAEFLTKLNEMRKISGAEKIDHIQDPWGNKIQYRYPCEINQGAYDLFSFGSDGIRSEDDIVNVFVADTWPPFNNFN